MNDLLPPMLLLAEDALVAAVPAVGFAMLFNVPRGALGYCALAGGGGHALRLALHKHGGLPLEGATLLAAFAISCVGIYWARQWRAHPKVYTVAAVIPMIPGVYGFTALVALLEIVRKGYNAEVFSVAVFNGLKAATLVMALAIGLALPGMLFYRRRPVV